MSYEEGSNSTSDDFYLKTCFTVKVHVTQNTMFSVLSDTVACFLTLFMAAISVCSNALVIRVYVKTSSVKTSGNLLLVSLSTLELLKSAIVQPAFFVWKVFEMGKLDFCYFYLITILGNNFCTFSSFLHTSFLVTIERYLSVFRPIFHRRPVVKQAFKIAALSTQFLCASFLLFTFFALLHRLYFSVMCFVTITCLVATALMYVMIRAKMRNRPIRNSQMINMRLATKQAADRRMNNTVISIILISLACYLPLFFVLMFLSFHARTVWHTRFVIPWTYVITFFTAALNPFVYCWKNRRLRNEMMKITSRVFSAKSRTYESSTASTTAVTQSTKV